MILSQDKEGKIRQKYLLKLPNGICTKTVKYDTNRLAYIKLCCKLNITKMGLSLYSGKLAINLADIGEIIDEYSTLTDPD